ncbi:hypothetical protein G4Z16_15305 [Streptomyces bathyalis]|uniref:Uncharacterized protein n=1 Tax=Streptomyces bathyalis TaxID=2710756 RepID=A0A7T1T6Y4_9ACTN|nr:esterase-like activity of phytase family protein [Streptomyces bathyalis]QPP07529.1 hypothetical protein G4Z16_15305 [Streptomyces bathyalis]
MTRFPDPRRSAAVVVGVGEYTDLPRLPAVAGNRAGLTKALADPAVLGLPAERCHVVADPPTSAAMVDPVIRAACEAPDTLIVYYAGHGFVDHRGELFLTLPDSQTARRHTAVPYDWLRQAILENSRAQRRIMILDCCYSGRALEGMAPATSALPAAAGVNGTYLLTSAAENVQALSPKDEECTAFTGELLRVLGEGVPDGQAFLTLDTVYERVRGALKASGKPEPQVQDRGRIGNLPFVHNRQGAGGSSPDPPPRWRPSRRLSAAAAVVLALAVAAPLAHRWLDRTDPGACSQHASLLGFSDRLDKQVSGLSSLAMNGSSRALAVSDRTKGKEAARLYELSLDPPEVPGETRLVDSTALRLDKDESSGSEQLDPEALVLEEGGKTVLVASEQGASVSRFDRESGRRLDTFEVPKGSRADDGSGEEHGFESMALSKDGTSLYVATKGSTRDGAGDNRPRVRFLVYKGSPGGRYSVEGDFYYHTSTGTKLTDLTTTDSGDLLALERGYSKDKGYQVRVHRLPLDGTRNSGNASGRAPAGKPAGGFGKRNWMFSLHRCPDKGAPTPKKGPNPLALNVEGMALGAKLKMGDHKRRQLLYLVSDDTTPAKKNSTRLYTIALDL